MAAVQTTPDGDPIAMRFTRLKGFRKAELAQWAQRHLAAGTRVVSGGLGCFRGWNRPAGSSRRLSLAESQERHPGNLQWVNTIIGNVKNSMHGSYHTISDRHLPRYLAEFCYRFNRRYKLEDMIPRLGNRAVRTPPMPQRLLSMAEVWG